MSKSKPSTPSNPEPDDRPWWLRNFLGWKLHWKIIAVLIAVPVAAIWLIIEKYPAAVPNIIDRFQTSATRKSEPAKSLNVAVFLPTTEGDSSANKDAVAQWAGFQKAYEDFDAGVPQSQRYFFHYDFDRKPTEEFAAHILKAMQAFYTEKDVRIFIITMSSAAVRLKEAFKAWRNTISDVDKRPVLVCTVASAPGIADIDNGILRYYVRSEEEATSLAHYGRWALNLRAAAVLFVTKDMGHQNDPYGEKSRQLFADEFSSFGGKIVGAYEIDPQGTHAAAQVKLGLSRLPAEGAGVFLAGYGTMFRETLAALAERKFKGVVLCTSTITEDEWHPPGIEELDIVSIEPTRRRGAEPLQGFKRKIVRFMAYETLLKALDCGRYAHTTPEFIHSWQHSSDGAPDADLQLEYMANGDTQIRLRPVKFPDEE